MSNNSNGVGFEIFLKDNLSNPLQQASQKGVAALGKLESAKGNLASGANGLQSSLGGVTGGITSMLVPLGLLTAGVGALVSGFHDAVEKGREFTKQMSTVEALSEASAIDIQRLEKTALALGKTSSFSASQVAEGFAEQFRAGMSVDESLQSIEGNTLLASASQVSLARATEISIATMHQFGLQAKDNQRTVDVLAMGNNMFATDLDQLADAMNYLGPTAHAFNVSLEESVAVYGALSNAGLRGSLATRALGTSITRMSAPTKQMKELMETLNIKFFDAEGKFIGINNTVGLLTNRFKGFTDEQRQSALATLFGAEAIQEWNILLSAGKGKLDEYTKKLENSAGTTKKMADTMMDNLAGDEKKLTASIEGAGIKVFNSFEGILREFNQFKKGIVDTFTESWDDLVKPFQDIGDLFSEIKVILMDLGVTFDDAGKQTKMFSAFLWLVERGLYAVTLPIRIVALAWKELIITFSAIYEAGKAFAERISAIFTPLGELFQGVFTLDFGKIKSGFSGLKSSLAAAVSDPIDVFNWEYDRLKNLKHETFDITMPPTTKAEENKLSSGGLNNLSLNNNGSKIETDVSGVGGKGKSIIVNIQNLINSMSVNGTSISELESKIKDGVTRALINAVNDFETSYN